MPIRIHALVPAAIFALASSIVGAQAVQRTAPSLERHPTQGVTRSPGAAQSQPGAQMIKACPPMIPGQIIPVAGEGLLEYAQGWYYKAALLPGAQGWAAINCYYGYQKSSPAATPTYTVHYEMTGFKNNQCSLSGNALSCKR